jgi:hypothetical protein
VVKRKADSIAAAVVDDLSTVIQVPYVPVNHSLVELTSQAADLSTLMDALKEKVNASSKFSEGIQLLTLTPDSWSRERVATEFEVSEHVVRAARRLKEERGILIILMLKSGYQNFAFCVQNGVLRLILLVLITCASVSSTKTLS